MNHCRVCGHKLFEEPLLRYENMPRAAQYLPDAKSLDSDRGVDLEVRQCSGCGLVQVGGEPVPYFREVIRAAGISSEMQDFRREQFDDFVRRFSLGGKKVIEIGCGRGEYLSILQQCDVEAYGLEYLEESVTRCRTNGLKTLRGFIETEEYKLENAPFDAFFMLNFLEHLPDPNAALQGISRNLAENGVGLVEVPNFDMILRENLFSEFIADHLLYFTKETVITTLRFNGFDVVECGEIWHDYIISAVVRKRAKLDVSQFRQQRTRLRDQLEQFVGCFGQRRVAVWGAGHQAFALISLCDLGSRIRYIVDSAPFKQGKYAPATHVPIVSPALLKVDPVDAVVVMAGSYSEEVVTTLRARFDRSLRIAVLKHSQLEEA